jgi:hypothetical protein
MISLRSFFESGSSWFVGVDACVQRYLDAGFSLPQARRRCSRDRADQDITPTDEPGPVQEVRGRARACRESGDGPPADRAKAVLRGSLKAEWGSPGVSLVGQWGLGGRNLGSGAVVPRNGRAEAHIWASELRGAGRHPPYSRSEWNEHSRRMGLSPDEQEDGWAYLTLLGQQESREPSDFVTALREFKMWWGYSVPNLGMIKMPQDSGARGWPFRTKAAERVFDVAARQAQKTLDASPEQIFQYALGKTGIPPHELTPEDDQLMLMAITWVQSGKYPVPQQPPEIPTNRSGIGFGLGVGADRGTGYLRGKGAP